MVKESIIYSGRKRIGDGVSPCPAMNWVVFRNKSYPCFVEQTNARNNITQRNALGRLLKINEEQGEYYGQ